MGEPDEAQLAISRFGGSLKRARKNAGLTQEQLAVEADISPITLSKLENGRSVPTLQAFVRLAQALSTTPNDLLTWDKLDRSGDPMRTDLVEGLDGLSTEWQDAISQIVVLAGKKR